MDKQQEDQIVRMYSQGYYIWEIAQRMNTTESEIVSILTKRIGLR